MLCAKALKIGEARHRSDRGHAAPVPPSFPMHCDPGVVEEPLNDGCSAKLVRNYVTTSSINNFY